MPPETQMKTKQKEGIHFKCEHHLRGMTERERLSLHLKLVEFLDKTSYFHKLQKKMLYGM